MRVASYALLPPLDIVPAKWMTAASIGEGSMTVSRSATGPVVEPLRARAVRIIALGVVYLIAGVVALSSVALATAISVFLVGIMMSLISGLPRSSTPSR